MNNKPRRRMVFALSLTPTNGISKFAKLFFTSRTGKIISYLLILFALAKGAVAAESPHRLTLQESMAIALQKSVTLHAAREGVTEAEARQKEAFSGFFPKIGTSYYYTRMNPAPFFNFPGFPPLVAPGTIVTGTNNNYYWTLELRQTLFAGGNLTAGYEIGRLGAVLARSAEEIAQLEVIKEVKIAYFQILKAQKLLLVAEQTVASLLGHRNQAQQFYDHGLIPKNDFLAAEVELASGRQLLLRAQNNLELAKAQFNILLRREINFYVELEDVLAYRPLGKTWDDCLKTGLENRPEIRFSALQVKQAQEIVKQRRSEFYPQLDFLGNYTRSGDEADVSGSAFKGQENWYVTVIARWNIWEGGRSQNSVAAGLSRERQALDASQSVRDRIMVELKRAFLLVQEAEQQIPTAQTALAQAEENFRITEERYREQVARATEVLDAQTILTRAQSDYYNALGDYHINLAGLERAMGSGLPPQ